MERTEIEPYKRNISASEEICELGEKKDKYIEQRREKLLGILTQQDELTGKGRFYVIINISERTINNFY